MPKKFSMTLILVTFLVPTCLRAEGNFKLAGCSSFLKLFFNEENSQILIRDLRDGSEWRSNPIKMEEDENLSPIWKAALDFR